MLVMDSMVELLQEEELELFVLTTKGIWKRRNDVVHGELFTHPNVVLKKASDMMKQSHKGNGRQ